MSSYTLEISGVNIKFQYSSPYSLLDPNTSYYFVQIITDNSSDPKQYYGSGIPVIGDTFTGDSVFVLTVFGDKSNVILMPTLYLSNLSQYYGLTLNAFEETTSNKIRLTDLKTINNSKITELFLDNVSGTDITGNIGNMGSEVYGIFQPISKNLAVNDANGTYNNLVDPSINTVVQQLIINTQLYTYLIKTMMPDYKPPSSGNGDGTNSNQKSSNTMLLIIGIIIFIVFIVVISFVVVKVLHHKKLTQV